jgi:hypothetical protein
MSQHSRRGHRSERGPEAAKTFPSDEDWSEAWKPTVTHRTRDALEVNRAFKDLGAMVLLVDDLEVALSFYRDVLGLEMKFQDDASSMFAPESVALFVVQASKGSGQLAGEVKDIPRRSGATTLLRSHR